MLCEYSAVNCTPYARVKTLLRVVLLALILGMQSTPAVRCTEGPPLIRPGCRLRRASRAPQKPPGRARAGGNAARTAAHNYQRGSAERRWGLHRMPINAHVCTFQVPVYRSFRGAGVSRPDQVAVVEYVPELVR